MGPPSLLLVPILLQRKYIDLIREASSRWVNWDPPIPIEIGAYGEVDSETGKLRVEGNIYDAEFQKELNKLKSPFSMADYPPQDGLIEDDFIVASQGTKRVNYELGPDVGVAGIANASFRGQWQFERGKRGAILMMHSPRQRFLPNQVILKKLWDVPILKHKLLVTSVHVCPSFCMYLSNKLGKKVSLSLLTQAPERAGGLGWSSDTEAGFLRGGCDSAGKYCYTPLFALKRRAGLWDRLLRDGVLATLPSGDHLWADAPTPSGDHSWTDTPTPWGALDDDGAEGRLDVGDVDE